MSQKGVGREDESQDDAKVADVLAGVLHRSGQVVQRLVQRNVFEDLKRREARVNWRPSTFNFNCHREPSHLPWPRRKRPRRSWTGWRAPGRRWGGRSSRTCCWWRWPCPAACWRWWCGTRWGRWWRRPGPGWTSRSGWTGPSGTSCRSGGSTCRANGEGHTPALRGSADCFLKQCSSKSALARTGPLPQKVRAVFYGTFNDWVYHKTYRG